MLLCSQDKTWQAFMDFKSQRTSLTLSALIDLFDGTKSIQRNICEKSQNQETKIQFFISLRLTEKK